MTLDEIRNAAIKADQELIDAENRLQPIKEKIDKAKKGLQQALEQLETNWKNLHAGLIEEYESARALRENADKRLRQAIVTLYKQTEISLGEKTPKSNLIPGWGVMVITKMEYDEGKAISFLIQHNHLSALKVNATKFEELAKALRPDFVTFKLVPSAKITKTKGD